MPTTVFFNHTRGGVHFKDARLTVDLELKKIIFASIKNQTQKFQHLKLIVQKTGNTGYLEDGVRVGSVIEGKRSRCDATHFHE